MQEIIITIRGFFININPLWVYLIISIIGLFIYWRGCTETRKDRSSIFDTFSVSMLFGLIMARVSYLVINWSEYARFTWYFLPYERYGDSMYFFRLLPWRLMRVWDGGLTIFVAMIAFLLFITILVTLVKKWRWYQVYFPVFFSMIVMLGISYIYMGLLNENTEWMIQGAVLSVIPIIFWITSKFLLVSIKNGVKRRKILVYIGALLVTLTSIYISYRYLLDDVSQFELISVITLILWTAVMDILLIIDINRPNVTIERLSSVRAVDIEINQPIKL
ncbi:TPA: hypothetical protein DEP90_02445 [Patescibacteria group bacterium]|nr:hypothetical protein [Patescibacteria group bacterium]